uniref:endoplasmic reticulum metallopeptidase 1-like n=1 Tax=Ciona intestinalis TaxID=7719 RepID=UPI00089DB713|nr:endoplasmic reticulum metallopeptidase 1-like [Ciona intestinalis]XP_026691360.1 endoplasmic reticulum metallopeptidase 1-like [Ciona intestinalis]|eukprot:XP_018668331.1 endoplasmic reticulum metallopeptidase 1-like [Ciona intestinalis]
MYDPVRRRAVGEKDDSTSKRHNGPGSSHKKGTSLYTDLLVPSKQWTLIYFGFHLCLLFIVNFSYHSLPKSKLASEAHQLDFIEENARIHLHELVSLGHRPAGSIANEIDAVNYILATVENIKQNAQPNVNIETSLQHPTGSFSIDFLGGFASYYSNITNTVVKLSPVKHQAKDALLLNCHTDSVSGGPGASDDAVACSVLLEVMRAMSRSKEELQHSIIFLFNGAEENVLQASHGFITQHPWAKEVQAFINLEAAGAGGKEIVFQTGPSNPWLALAWAQNAPHPFGSVLAQEVFQSGIIPSDTDFRIFRDYGKIPGIDLAYMKNGYVYHTIYDNEDMILPGCIQRAGENILAVVRHLVNSPSSMLSDPSSYRHGALAFMDILSVYMITLPMRMLYLLNLLVCGATFFILAKFVTENAETTNLSSKLSCAFHWGKLLLKALAVNLISWVASFVAVTCVAVFLTAIGSTMSFYSKPVFSVFLYVPPALAAMLSVHEFAKNKLFQNVGNCWKIERLFFHSTLLLWSACLFYLNRSGILSSIILLVCLLSLLTLRCFGFRRFFSNPDTRGTSKVILHLLSSSLPSIIMLSHSFLIMELFIPLCGRLGNVVPPDLVIGFLVAFTLCLTFSFSSNLFYVTSSMKMFIYMLLLSSVLSIMAAISPYGFPYSYSATEPTPKRLFLQHTAREFHNMHGEVTRTDSGVWTNCLDYPCFSYDIGSKAIQNTPTKPCSGLFCESPWAIPCHKLVIKSRYVISPPPSDDITNQYPMTFQLTSNTVNILSENSTTRTYTRRYNFVITGPDHMALQFAPLSTHRTHAKLTSWSIDDDISLGRTTPSAQSPGGSSYYYTDWYFIYFGSGLDPLPWKPWLELTITEDSSLPHPSGRRDLPSLEIAHSGQYYSKDRNIPVPGQTPELKEIMSDLHDWVTPMAWVSLYKSYLF